MKPPHRIYPGTRRRRKKTSPAKFKYDDYSLEKVQRHITCWIFWFKNSMLASSLGGISTCYNFEKKEKTELALDFRWRPTPTYFSGIEKNLHKSQLLTLLLWESDPFTFWWICISFSNPLKLFCFKKMYVTSFNLVKNFPEGNKNIGIKKNNSEPRTYRTSQSNPKPKRKQQHQAATPSRRSRSLWWHLGWRCKLGALNNPCLTKLKHCGK